MMVHCVYKYIRVPVRAFYLNTRKMPFGLFDIFFLIYNLYFLHYKYNLIEKGLALSI